MFTPSRLVLAVLPALALAQELTTYSVIIGGRTSLVAFPLYGVISTTTVFVTQPAATVVYAENSGTEAALQPIATLEPSATVPVTVTSIVTSIAMPPPTTIAPDATASSVSSAVAASASSEASNAAAGSSPPTQPLTPH